MTARCTTALFPISVILLPVGAVSWRAQPGFSSRRLAWGRGVSQYNPEHLSSREQELTKAATPKVFISISGSSRRKSSVLVFHSGSHSVRVGSVSHTAPLLWRPTREDLLPHTKDFLGLLYLFLPFWTLWRPAAVHMWSYRGEKDFPHHGGLVDASGKYRTRVQCKGTRSSLDHFHFISYLYCAASQREMWLYFEPRSRWSAGPDGNIFTVGWISVKLSEAFCLNFSSLLGKYWEFIKK